MKIQLMFWTPRVLGGLHAAFLSLFALDVFSEPAGFLLTLAALAIHLIPSAVIVAFIALSWRWESAAGVLFMLAGLAYCVRFPTRLDWIAVVAGPLFASGVLFLLNAHYRIAQQRTRTS